MRYYSVKLQPGQYRYGNTYTGDSEGIRNDIYESIARAADILYGQMDQVIACKHELKRLAQIDGWVNAYGTPDADAMLNEIFKKKS